MNTNRNPGDIAAELERLDVTLVATFVPFSQSRNRAEKQPSLNWLVTVKRNGREVITTDYMQGCAHAPAYNNAKLKNSMGSAAHHRLVHDECESGKQAQGFMASIDRASWGAAIPPPSTVDVMYSLLMDASAIDARDFADWCSEYGYSDDSISARATYDACIATATKLRAAFGEPTLAALRELFEGY